MADSRLSRTVGASGTSSIKSLTVETTKVQMKRLPTLSGETPDSSSPGVCPVCFLKSPKLTGYPINAVTSCGHTMCFECALRAVFVTKRNEKEDPPKCPICNQTLFKVGITRKAFETPDMAMSLLRSLNLKYLDIVYYDTDTFDAIQLALSMSCNTCNIDYSQHIGQFKKDSRTFSFVSKHLKIHGSFLCELCFYNLEVFPMELYIYGSLKRLQAHMKNDKRSLLLDPVQHAECTLCSSDTADERMKNIYFDNDALLKHCRSAHVTCTICTTPTTFYLNAQALAQHIARDHRVTANSIAKQATTSKETDVFAEINLSRLSLTNDHSKGVLTDSKSAMLSRFNGNSERYIHHGAGVSSPSSSSLAVGTSGDDAHKSDFSPNQFSKLHCAPGFTNVNVNTNQVNTTRQSSVNQPGHWGQLNPVQYQYPQSPTKATQQTETRSYNSARAAAIQMLSWNKLHNMEQNKDGGRGRGR